MTPPPPSNQPAPRHPFNADLRYNKPLVPPPAPAGDDAVRGIVERLEAVLSYHKQFERNGWAQTITDAIAALQRLAGEVKRLKTGHVTPTHIYDLDIARELLRERETELTLETKLSRDRAARIAQLETALAEARRQLEDRDGPDEAIEAMRAKLAAARAATDRMRGALEYLAKHCTCYETDWAGDYAKRALAEGEA